MEYEIIKGHPADRECVIGAYEACELLATYRGYYDWRRRAWTLYPIRRYALPLEVGMKKMTLSERDVHLKKETLSVTCGDSSLRDAKHLDGRALGGCSVGADSISARSETKAEPKGKAWWTLPDPDGQMKLGEV